MDIPSLNPLSVPQDVLPIRHHDAFAIVLYVLSAIGLVLFIVVMIFSIISWTKRSELAHKEKEKLTLPIPITAVG